MKRALLIAYLLALNLALFATIARPNTVRTHLALPNAHVQKMHATLRYRDATVPDGSAIFLGDSITERLAVSAVTSNAVNFGVGSQSAADLMGQIPHYGSLKRAGTIYLLIGTKDLQKRQPDWQRLLDKLPPDVPLVWSGVMPSVKVPPERLRAANATIRALCNARPNCRFVDTSFMARSDFGPDGVHPNLDGYRKWCAALRQ